MRRTSTGLAAAALLLGGAASARPLADGGVTADEMAQVLQAKGFQARIETGSSGDPVIRSGADGSTFRIYLSGCKAARCTTIQFAAAFDLKEGLSLPRINGWNKANRFGRAYLDDESDPFVEMDVDVEHGFSTEALANNLDTWAILLPRFKAYING